MCTLNFEFLKKRKYKIWSTLFIYFYMYRIISREFNTWFIQNLERNLCLFLRSLLFFIVYKITLFLFIPPVLETPCIVKRKRKRGRERKRGKEMEKEKKKERKVEERGKKLDASHGWVDRFVWSLIWSQQCVSLLFLRFWSPSILPRFAPLGSIPA